MKPWQEKMLYLSLLTREYMKRPTLPTEYIVIYSFGVMSHSVSLAEEFLTAEFPISSKLATKPNLMRSEGHTLFQKNATCTVWKSLEVNCFIWKWRNRFQSVCTQLCYSGDGDISNCLDKTGCDVFKWHRPGKNAHDVFFSRVNAPLTEESLHIHHRSAKLSLC